MIGNPKSPRIFSESPVLPSITVSFRRKAGRVNKEIMYREAIRYLFLHLIERRKKS